VPLIGNAPTTLLRALQKPESSPCQHGELADSAMNSGARWVSHILQRLVVALWRDRAATLPGNVRRSLASGMGELDRERRVGVAPQGGDQAAKGGLVLVRVQPEAGGRDAADRLDRGCFDAQQAGAAEGELAEMDQVPVAGVALGRRVLAHRRYHDAVWKAELTQVDGLEQGAGHGKSFY